MSAARRPARGDLRTGLLVAAAALVLAGLAHAELPVPELRSRVTDLTGTLGAPERAALEEKLAAFERRKGAQLAVLLVASTQPEPIEVYAIRVAENWRLGRAGIDDGALLLVATADRAVRIEVGYGLEGVLTDATARRIVAEVVVPRFRAGDFYGGIDAGVTRMLAVIDGEPLPEPAPGRGGGFDALAGALPVVFIFTVTLGAVLKRLLGQLPGALLTGAAAGLIAWALVRVATVALLAAAAAFLLTLLSRARPGRWTSGRGGSGGLGGVGGGASGGGFRGGGGGFGGGGASGRW